MKATETLVVWTPNSSTFDDDPTKGTLALVHEDEERRRGDFMRPYAKWDALLNGQGDLDNPDGNMVLLMGKFVHLVVVEKLDPVLVDKVFQQLDEYKEAVLRSLPEWA